MKDKNDVFESDMNNCIKQSSLILRISEFFVYLQHNIFITYGNPV